MRVEPPDVEAAVSDASREDVTKTNEKPERRQGQTIEEETGELKSWSSYKSAEHELGTVEGTQIHHIVEQSQGEPKRAQFDVARVNTSDNMTRLPKDVHTNISALSPVGLLASRSRCATGLAARTGPSSTTTGVG